jgi:hypothetical protein
MRRTRDGDGGQPRRSGRWGGELAMAHWTGKVAAEEPRPKAFFVEDVMTCQIVDDIGSKNAF